ncbi:hypothetical protein P4O66_006192, partial [Electrophorus voltai]
CYVKHGCHIIPQNTVLLNTAARQAGLKHTELTLIPDICNAEGWMAPREHSLTDCISQDVVSPLPPLFLSFPVSLSPSISFRPVQSLNSLNDQIAHFMVTGPKTLSREENAFLPSERDTLSQSMALMRHLLLDAQDPHKTSGHAGPPPPISSLNHAARGSTAIVRNSLDGPRAQMLGVRIIIFRLPRGLEVRGQRDASERKTFVGRTIAAAGPFLAMSGSLPSKRAVYVQKDQATAAQSSAQPGGGARAPSVVLSWMMERGPDECIDGSDRSFWSRTSPFRHAGSSQDSFTHLLPADGASLMLCKSGVCVPRPSHCSRSRAEYRSRAQTCSPSISPSISPPARSTPLSSPPVLSLSLSSTPPRVRWCLADGGSDIRLLPTGQNAKRFVPSSRNRETRCLPGRWTSLPYTLPTPTASLPYTLPTPTASLPYTLPTPTTSLPYTLPTPTASLPYTLPTPTASLPYTLPMPTTSLPYTLPTPTASLLYTLPTPTASLPYTLPTPTASLPYTLPTPTASLPYTLPTPTASLPYTLPMPTTRRDSYPGTASMAPQRAADGHKSLQNDWRTAGCWLSDISLHSCPVCTDSRKRQIRISRMADIWPGPPDRGRPGCTPKRASKEQSCIDTAKRPLQNRAGSAKSCCADGLFMPIGMECYSDALRLGPIGVEHYGDALRLGPIGVERYGDALRRGPIGVERYGDALRLGPIGVERYGDALRRGPIGVERCGNALRRGPIGVERYGDALRLGPIGVERYGDALRCGPIGVERYGDALKRVWACDWVLDFLASSCFRSLGFSAETPVPCSAATESRISLTGQALEYLGNLSTPPALPLGLPERLTPVRGAEGLSDEEEGMKRRWEELWNQAKQTWRAVCDLRLASVPLTSPNRGITWAALQCGPHATKRSRLCFVMNNEPAFPFTELGRSAGADLFLQRLSLGAQAAAGEGSGPARGRIVPFFPFADSAAAHRHKTTVAGICFQANMSSLVDFGTPESSLDKVLLRGEVAQLQEEVHLLRQMKEMLNKDLEESQGGCSATALSAAELRVQLAEKEQELDRAKETLQAMKGDRKRLKSEKSDLVSQMQQLYTTLESREEQLRDFIRNYDQHRKESEDAVKVLAKEKDLLEREKWDLRRQTKEATEHANLLRSHIDMKENRIKELEAELTMAKQSLATLTKDVPKRHSVAVPAEPVVNGSQEWVMQAELPLTAAIRQSQQTLYYAHPADRQGALRISPCHSRQPSVLSDASVADGDRSSTPSDMNSPRHRTHSLCNVRPAWHPRPSNHSPNVFLPLLPFSTPLLSGVGLQGRTSRPGGTAARPSMEDLEDQKRKKKKEKLTLGSLSRVFARGKSQRKSLDPGLFDDSDSLSSLMQPSQSDGEEQLERLQQAELTRTRPMSLWKAGTVQAWLEVVMAMPMYIQACSENVKGGKVLLGLTDEDLELGLGVSTPLHRRKLRLAIEDYREAESGAGLSKAADMDHRWVCKTWLSDVGLPQYAQVFQTQLVDGRVLCSLTRQDLETDFSITNQFHVRSLLAGIQLLLLVGLDKEVLQARRAQCEHQDVDPVVWSNHRVIKWVRDIDLKEYADSLQNSGVHGAVMVLDPSFSAGSLAKTLEIPSNKHMIHRHLYEEMKVLLNPARSSQHQESNRKDGTPKQSPASTCRYAEEGNLRVRAAMSPLRFNPKIPGGRDLSFHGNCGSLPREERVKALPRSKGSPMHGFSSVEITNI